MAKLTMREATRADARAIADIHVAAWRAAYRNLMPQGIQLMTAFDGAMLLGAVPAILAYPNFKVEPDKYRSGLAGVTANLQARVEDMVKEQLTHQADVRTRNRKPTRVGAFGSWEVRSPPLRIFYDVEADRVIIRAVVEKRRARYYRRGQEVTLDE